MKYRLENSLAFSFKRNMNFLFDIHIHIAYKKAKWESKILKPKMNADQNQFPRTVR